MAVSKQMLTAAIAVAGFSGFFFGGIAGCIVGHEAAQLKTTAASSSKVYTREEFRQAVMGKTEQEVLQLLGKPDRTHEDGPEWVYYDRRRDPLTGKLDEITSVRFFNGRVVEVR